MTAIASQVSVAKIGKYQILEKIGQGSTSTVYKGHDPQTDQFVAIKVIPRHIVADPVLRMRFAQECQVARKLDHPHIVRVLDFGLDGSRPFLVMEYVDGKSLGDRLKREHRLAETEAVRIITEIGQALHWAHQQRLIHRDVKPDNILLMASGQSKLTDLGLVKNLEGDANLTQASDYLGTPNFMPPEQFKDARHADALCDLYSLAATLYMTVTGEIPFRGRNQFDLATIYKKKLEHDLAPPRQLVPELSERLETATMRAMQNDPGQRQGSVAEYLAALKPPTTRELKKSGRDQRAKQRFRTRCDVACKAVQRTAEQPWTGHVVNVSETGLCLAINRRFERGSLLSVILEGERFRRRSLVVSVVWVRQQAAELWKIGCKFDQPLCEFEVEDVRDTPAEGVGVEPTRS